MKPENKSNNDPLVSVADIAREISRSAPGVKKALARLRITPQQEVGRIRLYPACTTARIKVAMRKPNLSL